ncbi:MAG: hypothetical protein ACTIK3_15040, partial [Sphingobacteriaceae bacterium]
ENGLTILDEVRLSATSLYREAPTRARKIKKPPLNTFKGGFRFVGFAEIHPNSTKRYLSFLGLLYWSLWYH